MSGGRFAPPPVADADRAILRDVALAYRRAMRAGDTDHRARDAAMSRYFELRPEAASDSLAASARVARLIASAVDPQWIRCGPDA